VKTDREEVWVTLDAEKRLRGSSGACEDGDCASPDTMRADIADRW
jgi:hypothetical protein